MSERPVDREFKSHQPHIFSKDCFFMSGAFSSVFRFFVNIWFIPLITFPPLAPPVSQEVWDASNDRMSDGVMALSKNIVQLSQGLHSKAR